MLKFTPFESKHFAWVFDCQLASTWSMIQQPWFFQYFCILLLLCVSLLYFTLLHFTLLTFSWLYFALLYFTLLHFTSLHFTILYFTLLYHSGFVFKCTARGVDNRRSFFIFYFTCAGLSYSTSVKFTLILFYFTLLYLTLVCFAWLYVKSMPTVFFRSLVSNVFLMCGQGGWG